MKNPPNRTFYILSTLNFGLLFYIYPFYWTFYSVFLSALILTYFFKDRLLSKQFLKILIGGLLIGSVYFYITFLASQLPEYQETMTRLQLVFSHSPSEAKSLALSLAVLILTGALYRFKKIKMNKEVLFFIAGITSVLIVTNQNIITGLKLESGHYRMLAVFFATFAVFHLLGQVKLLNSKVLKLLLVFLIGTFSTYATYGYVKRSSAISEQDIYRQKYAAVFDWLNENTLKDSVVYANEELSGLIPVYAHNNVFYARNANLFIISDKEVEERFILNNFFEKFDRDFITENERAIWGVRYVDRYGDAVQGNKWRRLFGLKLKPETRTPEEEIEKIINMASNLQGRELKEELTGYKVDYLIWDKEKNPDWGIKGDFKKTAELGHFVIFSQN